MQAEEEKEQVSDENDSSVHTLGSPLELTEPLEKAHKASKSRSKKSKDITTYAGKKSSKGIKRSSKFSPGNISFTSSSDEGSEHVAKKIKASKLTRIPDTQTMKGQLDKIGLTESQKFFVIQANRRGCLSLKWKAAMEMKTSYHEGSISEEELLHDDSSVLAVDISDEMENHLQGDTACNSRPDVLLGSVHEDVSSEHQIPTSRPCEDDEWDSIDLTDSQVKCLDKLEESADSSVEPVVKKEPVSDDDIQFIGEFVKGSYYGPRILADCTKLEYISPKDLGDYNKYTEEEDKLLTMQEKIENVC